MWDVLADFWEDIPRDAKVIIKAVVNTIFIFIVLTAIMCILSYTTGEVYGAI